MGGVVTGFRITMMLGFVLMLGSCAWVPIGAIVLPDSGRRSMRPGEAHAVQMQGRNANAIAGLSRVTELKATLHFEDGAVLPVEATSTNDANWEDVISTDVMTYKGAQVSDGAATPKVRVEVVLPEERIGDDAELRIAGRILYPADGPGNTFIDKTASFSDAQPIRMKGPGAKPTGSDIMLMVFSMLLTLGLLCILIGTPMYVILNAAASPKPGRALA